MVDVLIGDLLESQAQTLVNTVNCVGVMGKGIALQFKERFPQMFRDYEAKCRRGEVQLGHPYLYRTLLTPWVLNFPTKEHWRSVSRLADIIRGLEWLEEHYEEWGITSLAVPPLGCGQGGLEWAVVGPVLYRHLQRLKIPVELYAPHHTPEEQLQTGFLAQADGCPGTPEALGTTDRISPAHIALIQVLALIEREPYHWPVGRTTFQKIAYVATLEGIPTGLHFVRSSYGPFSKELKPLITRLVNNGLIAEEQLGRMLRVTVGPVFDDVRRGCFDQLRAWKPTIERTADLFLRLQTKQAEITATVLFAADEISRGRAEAPAEMEVLADVMEWKQHHRPPITETEVGCAIRNLAALDWLDVRPSPDLPLPQEAFVDA